MKRIKDGWVLVSQRGDVARQPFSAQPKVYYDDGTSQLLHIYFGESRQEAEAKANEELEKFLSQRG
ncbi:MAG: hypothetical protein M3R13_02885 [Armatimonadota bacterium]|nr:hypothetical protein [Armatimonadota bacterium]